VFETCPQPFSGHAVGAKLVAVEVAEIGAVEARHALARRAFAFPLLRGTYHGIDLAGLDPARATDRRSLLAADHEDQFGPPVTDQHLDRHVALADRLWRDDPPELWDAAQRLLDLGEDRHSVLHALMNAIRAAGEDENDIATVLADLPPEEPR